MRSRLERLGSDGVAGRLNPGGGVLELRAEVDRLLYEEIAERRAEAGRGDREDVLSLMIGAGGEDEAPGHGDQDLRDELMTLLAPGHETTSTGLSWAFERLMRTPERRGPCSRSSTAEATTGSAPSSMRPSKRRSVPARS